ncbi:MAG TPA: PKD domain-containing protein, partial [Bacteroidia bacterium]|nr:PKD domain-containing protein [Bacteroidia bacterium]
AINNPAVVNAGSNQTVCANNDSVKLSGTSSTGSAQWSSSGTGTFSPNNTSLAVTYIPSNADTAAHAITITLTSKNNGACPAVTSTLTITITPAPTVNAGPDQTVCANNDNVTLSGSYSVSSGAIWTTSGSGTFSPNATAMNATYTPSNADTTAGKVTLVLTSTGNGLCKVVTDTMKITITHAPVINAGSNVTVCANNDKVSLNGTSSTGSGTWTSSGTGTFTPNANTLNATYTPSPADVSAGTVTLTLTSGANGTCTPVNGSIIITITPPPTANAGPDQTVCGNNDSIKLSGTTSTGSGQWSSSGTGTFAPNNTTLNATYVPSSADTAAGTVTLTLTTTGNGGCLAVSDQLVITITHAPTVNAGPDQSVCANNANVTLNGSFTVASGAVWSTSGSGTFTPNNTTMNAVYTPSGADTAAGFVNIVLTSTGNGSCKAVTDTMKIIYTNAPTVEAGNNVKVCLSSPNYTLSGSSTTGKGTWVTLGSGTFVPNANTLNATYKPSTADTSSGSVILILTSTNNGGCSAVSDSIKITYTRTPTVNAGTNQTVCANNDNVSLSAASSTGTGTWTTSGSGTFSPNANTLNATYIPSNADTAAGTVTLTFTASGGCSPTAKSIVITITNAPYVNAGPDQSVCRNNANVTLSGIIGGATTTGVWSTSGSGTFSPGNTTLGATYIPSSVDTTAGKVTLVLTSTGNGSCLAVTDTMVIIYTPIPRVNAGTDVTVCANNDSVKLSGSSTTGAGAWTTSGSGIFSPNANTLNATYIPSNSDTAAGTVTLTLTSTSNGGCAAVTDKVVITIGHAPTANAGPDQSVCANNSNVTLSGAISNATGGQWSSLGSGTFSPNNTTLNGTYIPSAADTTAHSITLVLTTTGNGLCKAVTDTMIITITPAPKVEAGANVSVCRTSPDVTLNGSSSTGSATWSTSGTGTFTPNSSTLNATYIPSTADTTAGSVTLILTSGSNGNCNAVTDTMKIIYSKRPSDNAGAPVTVCANNDSVSLSGVSSTGSGIWTTSGTGTFSPNANTLGAIYVPSNADTTAGIVTLTLTTTNNGGCTAVSSSMVITITHAPTANAGPDQSICANATVSLSGSVTVASGGQWSTLGSGTFSPNNTTLNATYTPNAADTTAHTVTLVLSTTGNGQCKAATDKVVITINSGPAVNAGSDISVCLSSPDYTLNGTSSTGSGTWTTLGSGTFTPNANTLGATYVPSTADTSTHTVTLILTSANNGGCSASSDTMVITYTNVPSVNAGSNQTVCANNAVVTLNGTSGTGAGIWTTSGTGTFSPNANTLNATYTPSAADTTAHSVTLTLTATGGCSSASQSITITFTPAPFVNAGVDQFVCKNNPDVTLNGYVGGGSTTGAWTSLGSGTFTPNASTLNATYIPSTADTTAGGVTLILTSTNNGMCLASADTMVITFTAPPVVNAGPDESACANNSVPLNGVITGGSGTGIWTTPNGTGIFSPNNTTLTGSYTPSNNDTVAKNIILVLTSTNNGTCNAASDTMIITVSPGPIVNAGPDQTVCANNDVVTLSGSITNAGGGIWSTLGSGTFSPNNTTLNATYIPSSADTAAKTVTIVLTSTGNGLCTSATDTMVITISPAPRVNAGSDIFVCEGNTTASLNGSVSGGSSTGIWTTLGSGTFTPNDSALNPTYNLSTADTTAKTVTLILTSTHNGSCVSSSDTVVIKVTPIASVNAGTDTTVCANAGAIPLHGDVTGGSGTGVWSTLGSGTFNPNDSVLGASYTPSSADTSAHNVILVLNATGSCNPASDTVIITFTPAPNGNPGADQTICAGSNVILNGTVSLATGGKWSATGNGTFTPNDSTLSVTYVPGINDITAGGVNIILTTTGNGGCSASTDTMHVTIQSKPVANFISSKACLNGTVSFRDTSTVTTGSIVSWSWNLGNTTSTVQDPTDTYTSTGTQAVTLIVSTSAGCSDTITKNIYVNPLPVAMFTYKTFCPDSVNFMDASTIIGETITAWSWKFGDSAKSNLQDPSHTYPTSATYTVTLIAISDSGCSASYMDTVTVNTCNGTVSTAPGVPTAFTPNGDGTNDVLYVRGGPFSQFDFRIFNEWGTQIFQSESQSEGWDGTIRGTKQPAGTFTWTLVGTTVDGKAIKMTGNVTILR